MSPCEAVLKFTVYKLTSCECNKALSANNCREQDKGKKRRRGRVDEERKRHETKNYATEMIKANEHSISVNEYKLNTF